METLVGKHLIYLLHFSTKCDSDKITIARRAKKSVLSLLLRDSKTLDTIIIHFSCRCQQQQPCDRINIKTQFSLISISVFHRLGTIARGCSEHFFPVTRREHIEKKKDCSSFSSLKISLKFVGDFFFVRENDFAVFRATSGKNRCLCGQFLNYSDRLWKKVYLLECYFWWKY